MNELSARRRLSRQRFQDLSRLVAMFVLSLGVADLAVAAVLPTVGILPGVSSVTEGTTNLAGFIVQRSGGTALPLRVEYRISGTASNSVDVVRLSGWVTIPAGASSAPIPLATLNDLIEEFSETVTLTLAPSTRPFTLVALPDTQYYVALPFHDLFTGQTRWAVQNKDALNIAFVLHEGDCTDGNREFEWVQVQESMSILDGAVPYAIAVGNHDGLNTPVQDTDHFNTYFPLSHFQDLPSFGGVFESNRMDNCYHFFSAGGVDWLVLSYEFGPRDEVMAWANQIVSNHPNHRVICVTHAHVYSDDTLHGTYESQYWRPKSYGRVNDGTDVWEKFLRRHANISFVFNGHVLNDGAGRVVGVGDHGNKVYQMLANYQMLPNGGNGFLRLIEFDPAQDKFSAKSYSPYVDAYIDGSRQQFEYDNLGIFNTNGAYVIDSNLASATVTVLDNDSDVIPPSIAQVRAVGVPAEVTVVFSERIGAFEAEDPNNFQIDHGVVLLDATLNADQKSVTLLAGTTLSTGVVYTVTVNNVKDRGFLHNSMASNSQATFTYDKLLLTADFADGRLGNWTVVDQGQRDAPSQWKPRLGRIEQVSGIFGPTVYDLDHRLGTFLFWNRPAAFTWQDYTVSVTVNSTDDDGLGLMFHYLDPANYYKLELDQQHNFRKLLKVVNGAESTLATEDGGYSLFTDTELRVTLAGNQIFASVSGSNLFGGPITDPSLTRGTVALYCWGNAGVAFDNVFVAGGLNPVPPFVGNTNATAGLPPDQVTLIPIEGEWTVWEDFLAPDSNWKEPAFDDSLTWPGPLRAIFANEPDPIPDPRNTSLDLGPTTFYFRNRFVFEGSTVGTCLRLRTLLDDAAVFYLNGVEILRLNLPPGPITHNTLAATTIDNADYLGPFDLPVTNLIVGENLLAVEVHQAAGFLDNDVVFGAEVEAVIPRLTSVNFSAIRHLASDHVRLTLPGQVGRSYRIETSTDLAQWQTLTTLLNTTGGPLFITQESASAPSRFFRAFLLPLSCSER